MTDLTFAREVIGKLDDWVAELVKPLRPLRQIPVGETALRLEFRHHIPHAVMVGKLIRTVSALRAALVLADLGYVAESGALLRMVFDFCTEITAIGEALHRGGEPTKAAREFVDQYFRPKALTPEEYESIERVRYVSREELMKAEVRLATGTTVDGEKMRKLHQFLNMTSDSYVHGAYETTMELFNLKADRFELSGHPDPELRHLHAEAVALRLHSVVAAIELTAAVTATSSVFEQARKIRREMDAREPWKRDVNVAPPA